MVDLSEWLPKLSGKGMLGGSAVDWINAPFLVTYEGNSWTIATNGRTLVAIAGHLPEYHIGSDKAHKSVSWFLCPVKNWHETISLNLLRSWCGPAEYIRDCDCTYGCERCDYQGAI